MKYIRVKAWDKFQQYKDRDPKWIKVYRTLLNNYEYGSLPDKVKSHLIGMWLLAATLDNRIPADPKWIRERINATEPVDLDLLEQAGFIEPYNSVQTRTDNEKGADESVHRVEESREDKSREEDTSCSDAASTSPSKLVQFQDGKVTGLTDEIVKAWKDAYPAVDIRGEILRAEQWLLANPAKRKKNVYRFLCNWFARQQEKGGSVATNASRSTLINTWHSKNPNNKMREAF